MATSHAQNIPYPKSQLSSLATWAIFSSLSLRRQGYPSLRTLRTLLLSLFCGTRSRAVFHRDAHLFQDPVAEAHPTTSITSRFDATAARCPSLHTVDLSVEPKLLSRIARSVTGLFDSLILPSSTSVPPPIPALLVPLLPLGEKQAHSYLLAHAQQTYLAGTQWFNGAL